MKQLFQENRNAFLLLLALGFLLILTLYFILYRPLIEDLTRQENNELNLQEEIAMLEVEKQELESLGEEEILDIDELRSGNLIPDAPALEELVLTLNEIELNSSSRINNIGFGYDGNLPEIESPEYEDDITGEIPREIAEETTEIEGTVNNEETELSLDLTEMPEGLHPIIVTLEVESPDYEQLQLLLKEIERQERIMIVTNLHFHQLSDEELIFDEEADGTISTTVSITTFYFEGE